MRAFTITVQQQVELQVIPDSEAHCNGHPALTYTYHIYSKNPAGRSNEYKQSHLHLLKRRDVSYMGVINFDEPGHLINYIPDCSNRNKLTIEEVAEAIKQIVNYRETPGLWIVD